MNITYGLAQAKFKHWPSNQIRIYLRKLGHDVRFWGWNILLASAAFGNSYNVCHFQTKETFRSRLTLLLLLPLTFFCRSPFFSFLLFQALNLFLWYRNTDRVTLWKRSRVVCRLLQKCLPNFFIAAGFGSDAYRYIIIFL